MPSVYVRGNMLWCRLKGTKAPGVWSDKATGYRVGEEAEAERFAAEAQKQIDARHATGGKPEPLTVSAFAATWTPERKELGVRSWDLEAGQLHNHVLPVIGHLLLPEVTKQHIRDLMRAVRKGTLAPRTVLEIYNLTHRLFQAAIDADLIAANPCQLKRRGRGGRELPMKRDADPEWRTQATYADLEVRRLFSEPVLPVERRVQYALKALAALRHEEMAALRWRHYEPAREPLGALLIARAYDSRAREEKDTKTGETRVMPVHPTLAQILAAWKLLHWERIYGRPPTADDLIVPACTIRNLNVSDAGHALTEDLETLGLRVQAGLRCKRGGHDLRAWFITTCQTHGAHRDLLRVATHGAGSTVQDGYTRVPWPISAPRSPSSTA